MCINSLLKICGISSISVAESREFIARHVARRWWETRSYSRKIREIEHVWRRRATAGARVILRSTAISLKCFLNVVKPNKIKIWDYEALIAQVSVYLLCTIALLESNECNLAEILGINEECLSVTEPCRTEEKRRCFSDALRGTASSIGATIREKLELVPVIGGGVALIGEALDYGIDHASSLLGAGYNTLFAEPQCMFGDSQINGKVAHECVPANTPFDRKDLLYVQAPEGCDGIPEARKVVNGIRKDIFIRLRASRILGPEMTVAAYAVKIMTQWYYSVNENITRGAPFVSIMPHCFFHHVAVKPGRNHAIFKFNWTWANLNILCDRNNYEIFVQELRNFSTVKRHRAICTRMIAYYDNCDSKNKEFTEAKKLQLPRMRWMDKRNRNMVDSVLASTPNNGSSKTTSVVAVGECSNLSKPSIHVFELTIRVTYVRRHVYPYSKLILSIPGRAIRQVYCCHRHKSLIGDNVQRGCEDHWGTVPNVCHDWFDQPRCGENQNYVPLPLQKKIRHLGFEPNSALEVPALDFDECRKDKLCARSIDAFRAKCTKKEPLDPLLPVAVVDPISTQSVIFFPRHPLYKAKNPCDDGI